MQFRLLKLGGLDSNALYWNRINYHSKIFDCLEIGWDLQYAFRVVDLLSENGFIGEEKLKSFLREEGMAELVIRYSNALSFEALDAETRSSIERSFLENRETQTGIKQLSKTKEPSEEIGGSLTMRSEAKYKHSWRKRCIVNISLIGLPVNLASLILPILRDRILWRLEKEFVEKLKLEQDFESSRRLTSSQRLKAHFDKLKYYAPDHKDGFLSSNSVEEAFKKEKEALEKEMAHERGTVY
ncbi:hypothetical protein KEM48_013490 [Puccinia striiformis f. sp. tritici PST-130]|nr:hypothetical protein KEM48_013490 [Puccinia striiformis f. sp. tritici PST-130]